jgi:predicted nucleic acid-binding protein
MARKSIFDTSVFPDYASQIENLLVSSLFPSVIFFELVATSIDDTTLQKYERWKVFTSRSKLLINPTANDWWETAKAVRRLYMIKGVQQSKLRKLRNDALIARLSVVHDGFVVTHDIDDFQIIKKVMPDLKLIGAREFFES